MLVLVAAAAPSGAPAAWFLHPRLAATALRCPASSIFGDNQLTMLQHVIGVNAGNINSFHANDIAGGFYNIILLASENQQSVELMQA